MIRLDHGSGHQFLSSVTLDDPPGGFAATGSVPLQSPFTSHYPACLVPRAASYASGLLFVAILVVVVVVLWPTSSTSYFLGSQFSQHLQVLCVVCRKCVVYIFSHNHRACLEKNRQHTWRRWPPFSATPLTAVPGKKGSLMKRYDTMLTEPSFLISKVKWRRLDKHFNPI